MVVAGVMPTTFAVMGIVGQPLLFVVLGAVLILFSVGYAEMSRHVHNAGAFYAYISRGLGGTAGAGAALVALVAYNSLQVGIYGIFGFEVSGLFATYADLEVAWWIPALAAAVAVGVLGLLKIDVNAKVLGVLLVIEVLLVVVFDIAAVADPGKEGLSLHAFNPDTLTGAGVGTALCFCIAAFLGFEQAPVYAEETSRPHVLVPRVMFLAVAGVAVFFALSSWALTVATGPAAIVPTSQEQSAGLLFFLTEDRLGSTFTDVLHVLFVTGMFAAMLSFHNVVARYAFAMGREGLLPAAFGRTSGASGAPTPAPCSRPASPSCWCWPSRSPTTSRPGDPTAPVLHLFTWGGNIGALGVIVLMAIASLSVVVFFVRRGAAGRAGLAPGHLGGRRDRPRDHRRLHGQGLRRAGRRRPGLRPALGPARRHRPRPRRRPGPGRGPARPRPETHARIGLGNEAFQLEKEAERTP